MKAFLPLIFAQLIGLARGHPDRSEFGRYRTDASTRRRTELMILDNLEEKRQIRKMELFDSQLEERYEDSYVLCSNQNNLLQLTFYVVYPCSFWDIHRATLELSLSLSLSMSMSGPLFPSMPIPRPPTISALSPASSSPPGPSNAPGSPHTPGSPSPPIGPANVPTPSEPSGPSGNPEPTGAPGSPLFPSNAPGSPGTPGSQSIPTEPAGIPIPSENSGASWAPGTTGAPASPLMPTTPALIPTLPPIFSDPTTATEPSDPPQTIAPSVPPVLSPIVQSQPTIANDPINNGSSQPSTEPSSSGSRTGVSDCLSTNTLVLGTASAESSTPIALDMSYTAESNTTAVEDFEEELVEELIRTAAFAIFGCNPDFRGKIAANTEEIIEGKRAREFIFLDYFSKSTIPSCFFFSFSNNTCVVATCDPTVDDGNECFVLQTTFIMGVEGPVDTDVAAYEAYKAIQERMDDGTYTEAVPDVVFLEFLSPLPLLEPPSGGGGGSNSPDRVENPDVQPNVNVSPWTIGFSVASVMGGFVSLLVFARSRRSRQNRRELLDETTPWVSEGGETVV